MLSSIVDETIPRILVFNKAERASKERREELLANYPDALQISALENIGTEALRLKFIDLWNVWAKKRNLKQQEELKIAEGWTHE